MTTMPVDVQKNADDDDDDDDDEYTLVALQFSEGVPHSRHADGKNVQQPTNEENENEMHQKQTRPGGNQMHQT